jgi:pimeloyl-ACP methyl ester carboxylesterase
MKTNSTSPISNPSLLDRSEGRVGYEIGGDGPLVVLVPGMGDLRSAYRFMAPALRDGGYRVACTDLRGHGTSDTTFASYGDIETPRGRGPTQRMMAGMYWAEAVVGRAPSRPGTIRFRSSGMPPSPEWRGGNG